MKTYPFKVTCHTYDKIFSIFDQRQVLLCNSILQRSGDGDDDDEEEEENNSSRSSYEDDDDDDDDNDNDIDDYQDKD